MLLPHMEALYYALGDAIFDPTVFYPAWPEKETEPSVFGIIDVSNCSQISAPLGLYKSEVTVFFCYRLSDFQPDCNSFTLLEVAERNIFSADFRPRSSSIRIDGVTNRRREDTSISPNGDYSITTYKFTVFFKRKVQQ